MPEVRIGGAAREVVVLDVVARERPWAMDYWDGNWLRARVEIHTGGFDGRVSGNVRVEDFVDFRDEVAALHRTLHGAATFSTMEGWLTIELRGDGRSHIEVGGYLADDPGSGTALRFGFTLDQTFLPGVLASLDAVTTEFPVRGTPGA